MDYVKRKGYGNVVGKQVVEKTERIIEKPAAPIDLTALANAVASALSGIIPSQVNQVVSSDGTTKTVDTFDDSKTLDKLAQSMIVQRGDQSSNFDDLGN